MSVVTVMPFDAEHVGLSLSEDCTREEWEDYGFRLKTAGEKLQWAIGRWLAVGERKFGDGYKRASELTGMTVPTLRNIVFVCSHVSPRGDESKLSFSHHREVASLAPAEQKRWLDKAEEQKWTTHQLHDQLRLTRSTSESAPRESSRAASATPERIPKCTRCGQACRPCEIEMLSAKKKKKVRNR